MTVYTSFVKGICFINFEGYFDKKLALSTLSNMSYMKIIALNIKDLLLYNPSDLADLKGVVERSFFYLISDWSYPSYDLISFKDASYILKKHSNL